MGSTARGLQPAERMETEWGKQKHRTTKRKSLQHKQTSTYVKSAVRAAMRIKWTPCGSINDIEQKQKQRPKQKERRKSRRRQAGIRHIERQTERYRGFICANGADLLYNQSRRRTISRSRVHCYPNSLICSYRPMFITFSHSSLLTVFVHSFLHFLYFCVYV